MELIKKIAEYITPQNEKERVIAMGGKSFKPQAQITLERGIEKGMKLGREQGMELGMERGIDQGVTQLREAVEFLRAGGTPEELEEKGISEKIITNALLLK